MSKIPGRVLFTPEEDERLQVLRADGLSYPAIAKRLGRSIAGVQIRLKALREGRARPRPEDINVTVTPEFLARLDGSRAIGRYAFFRLAGVDADIVYALLRGKRTSLPPRIHAALTTALDEVDRLLGQKRSVG